MRLPNDEAPRPPSVGDDFVISAHALDRFQERFPALWTNDQAAACLIHGECEDALAEGRASYVAPLQLAQNDLRRWRAGKGLIVWTPMTMRGYVLVETAQGLVVATVLKGRTPAAAREMLYGERRRLVPSAA